MPPFDLEPVQFAAALTVVLLLLLSSPEHRWRMHPDQCFVWVQFQSSSSFLQARSPNCQWSLVCFSFAYFDATVARCCKRICCTLQVYCVSVLHWVLWHSSFLPLWIASAVYCHDILSSADHCLQCSASLGFSISGWWW